MHTQAEVYLHFSFCKTGICLQEKYMLCVGETEEKTYGSLHLSCFASSVESDQQENE